MVDAVVQSVIDKVGSVVFELGTRLVQLPDNIKSVQERMKRLQSYLKDAESKADNPEVKNLFIQIRDLAQDVEDIVDTYFAEIEPHNTRGPFGFLKQMGSAILCHCLASNEIANKIEKCNQRAEKLEELKSDLKGESHDATSSVDVELWRKRRKFLLDPEPKKIFGREEIFTDLEDKMHNETTKKCRIITIVGPGGVGKTTVARRLYKEMKDKLDCGGETKERLNFTCAMVYVSQNPNAEEILRDIAKQVGLSDHKMDENLEHNLSSFLQDKRYVIFLDDVWNKETWDQLKDALAIASENGSRIIVTSRYDHVGGYIVEAAKHIDAKSFPYTLDVLSENYAKEFFKDMLPDYEEIIKPVKDIGDQIVQKCGGLPLAIEVVVGMLRGRPKTTPAWKEVLGKMSRIPENDCLKILALSYKDLQPELKPFFLYFGIFPQNREIFVPELIPLWIAENLIQVDGNQDDCVENKINELISRNLVQKCSTKFDGRVRSCRIHSLVHDLCTRVAEESNYFCTRNNLKSSELAAKVRRVTINTNNLNKNAFHDVQIPKIRALFCFSKDGELFNFLKDNASVFRFLRLLIIDFDDGKIVKVPEEIANLSGLIYLKMVGNLSEIPARIRRLKRLQTLEIRSSDIPEGVLKMKHVKHLFLSSSMVVKQSHNLSCFRSGDVDQEIEVDLPNIESLDIDFGPKFSLTPSSVKKLTNLRRFRIYVTKKEMLEVLFAVEPVLPHLEDLKLKICVSFFHEIPNLDLSRYQSLKKLNLYFDTAYKITSCVVFPPNVVKISLKRVTNMEDHMESLKQLSNLERIKLKKCRAEKLDFSGEGSFPRLQLLMLKSTVYGELVVDEYGMPNIWKFKYAPSPLFDDDNVPEIPERLVRMMEEGRHLLESALPELPKPEILDLPKPELPTMPKPELPALPKPEIPTLPKPELPIFPKPELPKLEKAELPPLAKPELPELPKPELPEIPKPELPTLPKPELPTLPKPEVPKPTLPEGEKYP